MLVRFDIGVLVEQLGDFRMTGLAGLFGIGQVLQVGEGFAMHRRFQVLPRLGIQILGEGRRGDQRGAGNDGDREKILNNSHNHFS